jgi:diguanylate cyclase (GGDEF)-like protein
MTGPGPASTAAGGSGLSEFAQRWASAVAWTSYVPMARAERLATLTRFAEQVATALTAQPFSEQPGHDVGTGLVRADFAAPETLGSTIQVIDEHLLAAAGIADSPDVRHKLARLLGALATGYTWALRDRTLDEQESIRAAAFMAREQAAVALRESEARFRHAALHDPLTDLPNRTQITDRLTALFEAGPASDRVALCFIDLDSFQTVNDSLGHQVGDRLLIAVAKRLGRLAKELDHIAARFSADEFVLLMVGTCGAEDAVKAADQVMAALVEPFHVDGHELTLTASIGIVESALGDTDAADLLRAADMTLHWAKTDGRARLTLFNAERNAREVERYTRAAQMPGALNRGEFTLLYQPIIGLAERSMCGVEALARWDHPELGRLAPSHFIDLAEHSGLIVPLGLKLLEQACRQAAQWLGVGPDSPYVSVNLAVRQIRHPHLVADVAAVLDRTGLPPHKLQLEITESAFMGDDPELARRVRDLANLGVRLAIDDFGTGYSNLTQIRTLPVHCLKLAAEFVRDLGRPWQLSEAAAVGVSPEAFLRILVTLGHTLGLTVTAEGVETLAQTEVLAAVGCESGQGYYFSYPVAAEQITARLMSGEVRL